MNPALQLVIVISISASAACVTWLVKDPSSPTTSATRCDPNAIKADEICFDQVSGNVLWIDARSRNEWEKNGYPNSILWNLDPNEDSLKMESDAVFQIAESEKIVVYCGSEACGTSRLIVEKIQKLELGVDAKVLHGGYPSLIFNK
jgi:rhodanese-related sulfurtransferase